RAPELVEFRREPETVHFAPPVPLEVIEPWIAPEAREYASQHLDRFAQTLSITPVGDESKSILEMGAYMQITPGLKFQLGYGIVRGCYFGSPGHVDHKTVISSDGQTFQCDIDHFNAERDIFPYPDSSFNTVLCCELIEHLETDPMHMMGEINRILRRGGH